MAKFEGIQEGPLTIGREDRDGELVLVFEGKSILRDPTELLQPLLFDSLSEASESSLTLVLDFRKLTYMNSSTFTPVVKTLEKARVGTGSVRVLFNSEERWQSVSFAALSIFATRDGRISVSGDV